MTGLRCGPFCFDQGCSNPFAQKAVREKAAKLHTQFMQQLRIASGEDAPASTGTNVFKETGSTGQRADCSQTEILPVQNWSLEMPQERMNGDTFSIKAPKECSKKF